MNKRRLLRSRCETQWKHGRWHDRLSEEAWMLASRYPDRANFYLAMQVQHALQGLQAHHLDLIEKVVEDTARPWHPLTLRLLSARVQAGEFEQALSLLEQHLSGRIDAWKRHLLRRFPLCLAFIQAHQPERIKGNFQRLAKQALELDRACGTFNAASVLTLRETAGVCEKMTEVAVVGNARRIMNAHDGTFIDNHDVVIRFNAANISDKYQPHTGSRTDLWVISPSLPKNQASLSAQAVAVTGISPLAGQNRFWSRVHRRSTGSILCFEPKHWYALVKELSAPPSAGLLVLEALRSDPDILPRLFGFSGLTERHSAADDNHYSDARPASHRHDWQAEAAWLAKHYGYH